MYFLGYRQARKYICTSMNVLRSESDAEKGGDLAAASV